MTPNAERPDRSGSRPFWRTLFRGRKESRAITRAEYPPAEPLRDLHVRNARVLPNRYHLLPLLPKGCTVVEIGVAFGDFSERILEVIQPTKFVAIDRFELHLMPSVWGRETHDAFDGGTHEEHYRRRFAREIESGVVAVRAGDSHREVAELEDGAFDMVYVDAAHDYDSVCRDLAASASKVATDGLLVMNDYTMFDPLVMERYGVVQATNEFCVREGWEIVYFALEGHMFCDVALRRIVADGPSRA